MTVFAQKPSAPAASAAKDDPDFARLVKQWTTGPEFSSPLVDHLPKVAGVPSPKDVLGYYIGEPKKLTYVADIDNYLRALAAASPRVKVMTLGKTDEGRDFVVAFVGSEDSIRNLDTYKGYLAKLADPRGLSDADARDIIAKAKPIYHVTGGLHSSETGPPEMLMEPSLSPGHRGFPPHPADSRQHDRGHQSGPRARWPRPLRGLVLPPPR